MMSNTNKVDVHTFLDDSHISLRQWLIIFLGFMVLTVDGFDMVAMGLIVKPLSNQWHIPPKDFGPALMSGLFGLVIGSLLSGPLADRFGRKWIVIGSVFFFGSWNLASAYAWNMNSLVVLRLLTGVGLGAAMPNITTLISEFAPKRYRAALVTAIYCGFNVGAALGSSASGPLIESHGWQSVLIAGGVIPLALILFLIPLLPESMRFLAQNLKKNQQTLITMSNQFIRNLANNDTEFFSSEEKANSKGALGSLFNATYGFGTFMIWITLFVGLFSVYLMSSWLPTLMSNAGFNSKQAANMAALYQAGGVAGNLFAGMVMGHFGYHCSIIFTICLGALIAFILAFIPASIAIMGPFVFVLGYAINGINPSCYALSAHYYPTPIRATGISWATGIGRIGAITGAGVGSLMLAANWSVHHVFMFMPIILVVGAVAIFLKYRHSKRLDQAR